MTGRNDKGLEVGSQVKRGLILGRTLPGGVCSVRAWKRVWSCKAGRLARSSWTWCGDCWWCIPIGADIGSRATCAGSGTGAASRAKSRTWRPAHCCSIWNSRGGWRCPGSEPTPCDDGFYSVSTNTRRSRPRKQDGDELIDEHSARPNCASVRCLSVSQEISANSRCRELTLAIKPSGE